MAAEQDQRQRRGIVAAVEGEIARRAPHEVGPTLDIGGRVLDADDAGDLRQAKHRVVREIRHRAAGHVVQDHRQVDRLGDLAEVAVQAFLRRLVVVRHDRQAGGGAGFLRRLGELDRFGRRVAAGAGDDRDAPARVLHGDADQLLVLVEVDGRRFAGRADDDDAVRALGGVPVDEIPEAREVERAVLAHGSDDGDQAAGDHADLFRVRARF